MNIRRTRLTRLKRDTDGTVAVMTVFMLVALLGAASLAIDMGQLYMVRNSLQNTADAAALAAAGNLITTQGGVALRDANAAQQAALTVAQRQSELSGLPTEAPGERNDLTITFGEWNLKTGDPQTAWTEIGSTCGSTSNANAIRVTLRRGVGLATGPVCNLFAHIFGVNTSAVSASATAYLGYTNEAPPGTVQVPLALPNTILTAPHGRSGWFARLLGPREAVADTTKTLVFKDTGGGNVASTVPTSPTASLDSDQGYFFTGSPNDSVPNTTKNTLAKIYTPSLTGTSNVPVLVPDLKLGQQIYPRSEYPWGRNYIGPISHNLQKAYNYKTTGSASTAPASGTTWRTTLVVHGLKTLSYRGKPGFKALARLLALFSPREAFACSTITYPTIQVSSFVNVDITGVTYNSSSCDDCNYSFPERINGVRYNNKKDCLTGLSNSTWNANTVRIQNVVDASTVSPPGTLSGGPPTKDANSGAPENVGALATIPRLVK